MINLTSSADARNSEVAPTFTVVSTAAHDRAWWAEEASRASTDWPSVVAAALELLVASGILEPNTDTMTPWDALSWRQAAVEYHRDRPGPLTVEIEPKRLARLRGLMGDDISIDRAWHELRDHHQFSKANSRKGISDDGRNGHLCGGVRQSGRR
jgi:hypothetical protein